MQDGPFIWRQGWSSVLLIGLGLCLGAKTYRCPTTASVVPSTCLPLQMCLFVWAQGHHLALVTCRFAVRPALCPNARPRRTVGPAFCVCAVHLLDEGQALLLTLGGREESLGNDPSRGTHLRLGQSQDSVLCVGAGCVSAIHWSPSYMKNVKVPGDYFCKQKRWQQMWKQIYSSWCKLVLCFYFCLTINRYSWKYLAVKIKKNNKLWLSVIIQFSFFGKNFKL